jgi:hypothetical protein
MTKDNTKAFSTLADNGHLENQDGMDLRDYFAAKAMQSLVMNFENDATWNAYEQAFFAYKIADAMMQERKEK